MIQVQRLTGARPGEVCVMRAIDIDMRGHIWLYRPGSDEEQGRHKTAHHGHTRVIAIGPKAQEVIKPFLTTNLTAYFFRPVDALDNPKWARRRKPGEHYTVDSYRQAIERGCDRAFPPPATLGRMEGETCRAWRQRLTAEQREELKAWQKAHRWHPHQLRHSLATEIRREHGLDAARAVLGHRSPAITEIYAELDANKAAEVMGKLG
jgi:integrase